MGTDFLPMGQKEAEMNFLALIGRILFSIIFIMSGLNHFSQGSIDYAASNDVPMAAVLVPLSGVLAIIGGACILLGFKARFGAVLIILFLLPVTFMMHDFWNIAGAQERMMQQVNFLKNLALLGGACYIAYAGAGAISFDALIHHKPVHRHDGHRTVFHA